MHRDLAAGKPKRWYYAIPFVIIWLLVLWIIIRQIVH